MDNLILDPAAIERRSMEIIASEMGACGLGPVETAVLKRVIHTSADFDYVNNLTFSGGVCDAALSALKAGATVVTDTEMARSGINKSAASKLNVSVRCFIGDPDVAKAAEAAGTTRSAAAVDRAVALGGDLIFVVGNAPTALLRIHELVRAGALSPRLIVGVPVGFVNVVESKELILGLPVPHIVARGRKGGSNVAASIVNALLYEATGRSL